MQAVVTAADELIRKTGASGDFLGWLDSLQKLRP